MEITVKLPDDLVHHDDQPMPRAEPPGRVRRLGRGDQLLEPGSDGVHMRHDRLVHIRPAIGQAHIDGETAELRRIILPAKSS